MFSAEDLKCLDPRYFNIISVDAYDVTVMSRNTGHCWYLHNPEYPGEGTVIILHKHKYSHPYHQHGRTNTLRQAVRGLRAMISGRWAKRNNIEKYLGSWSTIPGIFLS